MRNNGNYFWQWVYSPATGVWTRIAPPDGFSGVNTLTPLDVNSAGQVVGYFNSGGTKGFVWTPDPASPAGGHTTVYYLNPGGSQTLAIPKRISDTGYITANAGHLGGRSLAARLDGTEITFTGMFANPVYHDVNDYGEFVGTVYNPWIYRNQTFIASEWGPIFFTGIGPNALDGMAGIWGEIPDIDPDAIVWASGSPPRTGTAIDRQTLAVINVREDTGTSFYWKSAYLNPYGLNYWYSYPGFSQSLGSINDWGEFAGLYTGTSKRTYFDGSPGPVDEVSDSGIFFYDGDYHASKTRPAIYGASNAPRVLTGTPFAIWSGSLSVAIANLIPAGGPTNFAGARIAANGNVILQPTPITLPLRILKPDQDADNDGMPDDWEKYYGFNPNNASDAYADSDEDGFTNLVEFKFRTNPSLLAIPNSTQFIDLRPGIDTDGDGMPNVWEWKHGMAYNNASDAASDEDEDGFDNLGEFLLATNPRNADSDDDGLSDSVEMSLGTNPNLPDTDGDGAADAVENANGSDAKSAASVPPCIPRIQSVGRGGYATEYSGLTPVETHYDCKNIPGGSETGSSSFDNLKASLDLPSLLAKLKVIPYQSLEGRLKVGDEVLTAYRGLRTGENGGQETYGASSIYSSSYQVNYSNRKYAQILSQNLRLENDWAAPADTTYHFVKVHLEAPMPALSSSLSMAPWTVPVSSFTLVEELAPGVELMIPKGGKFSSAYEIEPPAAEMGKIHLRGLIPSNLILAIPQPPVEGQPAGSNKIIIPEDKEDAEGGWLVLNFDDDDEDGGAADHGHADVKGDWEDTNGVEGENDMIYLAMPKIEIPGVKYRLKFNDEHIRIYRKANKTEPVQSESTQLTVDEDKEYLTLYVEGVKPHENDAGTIVTHQIRFGSAGDWIDGDTVKLRVAQPVIAVFEDNPDWWDTYASFQTFASGLSGSAPDRKRFTLASNGNGSPDTFLTPGKFYKSGGAAADVCYSISSIKGDRGERILKIALALQNANVVTVGHANFGLGLAFRRQYTEFTDFFNCASGGKPAINLTHGFPVHPALNVDGGVFVNLAMADKINNLRWNGAANKFVTGVPLTDVIRYQNAENPVIGAGQAFPDHVTTVTQLGNNGQVYGTRQLHWHYKPIPDLEGDGDNEQRVILNLPSTDVPATLRYRSLYLNQCNTYRYFLESFRHGAVFATMTNIMPDNLAHEEFIQQIIQGTAWQQIEPKVEAKEAVDRTEEEQSINRIEFTNF